MITARIVNIDRDYEQELGLRYGLGINHKQTSADGLVIDQPSNGLFSHNAGLAIFNISKNIALSLELSALETEGHADIISSPKLLTTNQQSASIEAGQEIPYQQQAYGGNTNIAFKKAVLRLEVTPQIVFSNSRMSLKV